MGEGFVNENRLEISNFGHVRAFNKITKGKVLKGSMINGYRIIRQKLFKARDPQIAECLWNLQATYLAHAKKLSFIKKTLLNESIKGNERTLLNQEFVKDTSKTVGQYIKEADPNLKVRAFSRLQLGSN